MCVTNQGSHEDEVQELLASNQGLGRLIVRRVATCVCSDVADLAYEARPDVSGSRRDAPCLHRCEILQHLGQ